MRIVARGAQKVAFVLTSENGARLIKSPVSFALVLLPETSHYLPLPATTRKRENGKTLLATQFHNNIIVVDRREVQVREDMLLMAKEKAELDGRQGSSWTLETLRLAVAFIDNR